MQAVSGYVWAAIATAGMMAFVSSACRQETRLKVPKVIVMAQACPGRAALYARSWKAYARNPYFGPISRGGG